MFSRPRPESPIDALLPVRHPLPKLLVGSLIFGLSMSAATLTAFGQASELQAPGQLAAGTAPVIAQAPSAVTSMSAGDDATDPDGRDHAGIAVNQSPAMLGGDPSKEEPAATEALMKEFKEKAPPDLYEKGLAAVQEFETVANDFKAKVLEMRRQYIFYINGYSDDRATYQTLRNESRDLMNLAYRKALDAIGIVPHPVAMRFVVTVLDQRVKHDVYDAETFEGAAKLLDYGVRLRYVAIAAARAAVTIGDFPLAENIYKNLKDEELDDKDRSILSQMEQLKKQFEVEKELLANDPEALPQVRFLTTRGEIVADLFINEAPSTVAHFIGLVESGFYDGLDFFQVVDGLLALTGDPLGDGSSRPDRFLADEHNRDVVRMPLAGSLVMAKLPGPNNEFVPNTGGTQFAILYLPFPLISSQQTIFGRVTKGVDVLGSLQRVDPHKEKKKGEVLAPPDRIIEAEILNRPETLPEVIFAVPPFALP